MKTVFKNAHIITMNSQLQVIQNGYLVIEGTRILTAAEGEYQTIGTEAEIVDVKGSIILPGLLNAHSHSYSNMVKGTSENIPLELWMLYVMKEGNKLSEEDVYISSLLGSTEMLKGGTTAFLDHLAQPVAPLLKAAKAYNTSGIRSWITPMFTDKSYEETLPGTKSAFSPLQPTRFYTDIVEEFYKQAVGIGTKIKVGIGPSAPHRCTDDLLTASYELAVKYRMPWHTHVLESYPQKVKAEQIYQKSMVEHLKDLKILSDICSLAHVTWLSEKEMELLADHHVSVVHNPVSNLYLGSGVMPLLKVKAKGINVALGTDGANCNGGQSMFETMKLTSILSNTLDKDYSQWISSMDVLQMATVNSAKALLADDELGSLEVGKEADFLIVNKNHPSLVPLNNLIWQIVYGSGHHVSAVYIAGEKVVDDGKVLTVDEESLYEEANERAHSLMKRLEIDYQSLPEEKNRIAQFITDL